MENFGFNHGRINSLDLSKAFDRLKHLDFIEALRRMKPNLNSFVNVFFDFLGSRTQRVVFRSDISDSLPKNQ